MKNPDRYHVNVVDLAGGGRSPVRIFPPLGKQTGYKNACKTQTLPPTPRVRLSPVCG